MIAYEREKKFALSQFTEREFEIKHEYPRGSRIVAMETYRLYTIERIHEFGLGGPNKASAEREPKRGSGGLAPVWSRGEAPGRGVRKGWPHWS